MYAVNHVCVPQLTYWLEYGYFVLRDVVHAVTVTACLRRPITWSMAIVFSVRSSMLLTVKKEMHRFLFLCMHVVLSGPPELRYEWFCTKTRVDRLYDICRLQTGLALISLRMA